MNSKFMRNGVVMLILVIGTAALLYAWINQGTTSQRVGYGDFLTRVGAGQVQDVTQKDNLLAVTPKGGGAQYTVVVPTVLTNVLQDMKEIGRAHV